jgi:signal peptidase II
VKKFLKHNGLLFLIATAVIVVDQLTKSLVRQNLALGEAWAPIPAIGDFFRFLYWQNRGAAFGSFQNAGPVLTVVRILIAIFIIVFYQKTEIKDLLVKVSLSLMLGGAVGNLVDQFTLGFVTDFIAVGRFPIFNVADSCVTIGVGLMLLDMIIKEKNGSKTDPEEKPGEDA